MCVLHGWAGIIPPRLPSPSTRALVSYGREEGRSKGVVSPGIVIGGGQDERGAEVITEREPLVAPGACVQIRPSPLPLVPLLYNPPDFTFPGTRPPGDTVGFQRAAIYSVVSRNVKAADRLKVGCWLCFGCVRWLQGPLKLKNGGWFLLW